MRLTGRARDGTLELDCAPCGPDARLEIAGLTGTGHVDDGVVVVAGLTGVGSITVVAREPASGGEGSSR